MSSPYTFVITGANRGIGRALVAKLHEKHADAKFILTVRNEEAAVKGGLDKLDRVSIVHIDFEKMDTIRAGAEKIAELAPEGIDEVWNNAGYSGAPASFFGPEMEPEAVVKEMTINVVAPIFFTTQLLSLLDKKDTRRVNFVGSVLGCYNIWSQPQAQLPVKYVASGYAASKAGLAFAIMGFAALQKPRGYTVVGLHPGLVDTDMTAGIDGDDAIPKMSSEDSATQMIATSEKRTKDDEYHFLKYDGSILC